MRLNLTNNHFGAGLLPFMPDATVITLYIYPLMYTHHDSIKTMQVATHTGRSQQLSVGERCRRLIGHILFLDTKQTYLESHFNFESQITITSGMLRVKPRVKTITNLKQQDDVKIKCHKSATAAVTV
jgi:hypothetical protein